MTPQSIQQALQQIVASPEVHKRSILTKIEKIIKRIGEDIMEQNKDMVGADHGCSLPIVPDISAITALVYTKHDVEHQTVAEYLATGNHMLSGASGVAVQPACTHGDAITQYTGDGSPVSYCPDCGRNEPIGGAAVRGEAVADSGSHHAWKRSILYTDTIGGKQTCRDDLWAITTTELKALQSARAADASPESSEREKAIDNTYLNDIVGRMIKSAYEEDGHMRCRAEYEELCEFIDDLCAESRAADALDSQPTDGGVHNG